MPARPGLPCLPGALRFPLLFTAVVLFASYSAQGAQEAQGQGCLPVYRSIGKNGSVWVKNGTIGILEEESFSLSCLLSTFQTIKWNLNQKEVGLKEEPDLGISIRTENEVSEEGNQIGLVKTVLFVGNATRAHSGVYKCVWQCMNGPNGNKSELRITVNVAKTIKLNFDDMNGRNLIKFGELGKETQLKCNISDGQEIRHGKMTWSSSGDNIPIPDCLENTDANKCVKRTVNHRSNNTDTILTLHIIPTTEDWGPYECKYESQSAMIDLEQTFTAQRRPIPKGHRSITVVGGQSLEISCTIKKGNNANYQVRWLKDDKILDVVDLRDQNSKINYTSEANFTYLEAEPEHSGVYKCQVINIENNDKVIIEDSFLVRVKDKLGALWPFLTICGECVLLLLIIVIYERRRSKAELEESDTDASPPEE